MTTASEAQVEEMLLTGLDAWQIALRLGVSPEELAPVVKAIRARWRARLRGEVDGETD